MKRIKGAVLAIGLGLALSAPAMAQTGGLRPLAVAGTADTQSADANVPPDNPPWCPDPYSVGNGYFSCLHGDKGACQYVAHQIPDLRACVRRIYERPIAR